MDGFLVFVDAPKPGADPQAVAAALSIDAYRARMLGVTGAPFLARGFASLDLAGRAAAALDAAGFPATAHGDREVAAIPKPAEALSFVADSSGPVFLLEGGQRRTVAADSLRSLVLGKIQVKVATEVHSSPAPPSLRGGLMGLAVAAIEASASSSSVIERVAGYTRLEIFVEEAGSIVRIGIRHDRFDFSQLLAKKTLSAARNLETLRDLLARGSVGVVVDEAFQRTELAHATLAPDVWVEYDLGGRGGAGREVTARSNRQAFDLYARARHLHDLARRRATPRPDHFYEL